MAAGRCFRGAGTKNDVFVFDPTDDYFLRLLAAGFSVELEQTEIVAAGAFLLGRCGQVCSELCEQAAERFQMLDGGCFCVVSIHR